MSKDPDYLWWEGTLHMEINPNKNEPDTNTSPHSKKMFVYVPKESYRSSYNKLIDDLIPFDPSLLSKETYPDFHKLSYGTFHFLHVQAGSGHAATVLSVALFLQVSSI